MAITTPVQAFKQNPQVRERTHQVLQQTVQQRPDLSPELLKDHSKISDEFMDEVGKIGETQGYDPNMLSALAGNFLDQKANQDPPSEETKKPAKVEDKKPKVSVEAKWDPMIRAGETIPKQGKIGEVHSKITSEPAEEEKKADKAKGGSTPSKIQAPQAAAAGQKSAANAPKNNDQSKDDEKEEKVEFSQESKEMLNQMHSQGMKSPGLDPSQSNTGNEAKPVGKGGGKRSVSEKTDEVFMPSQGVTQAAKVRERGQIKNGDVILTYRKLDDLPSGSVAILKGKTGKEGLEEYSKRIQEGEKIPELTKEQQRQLLDPIAEK